jgi:uncharacterized protein YkwD
MSDDYGIRRYHRRSAPVVLGINKRKKYLRWSLVLMVAGVVFAAYLVYSSGILADDNPRIPQQLVARINQERLADNLPAVQMDDRLANLALGTSRELSVSSLTYTTGTGASGDHTNVFVIPKISWAISGYDAQQQLVDTLENDDSTFRDNIRNSDYKNIGIGVTGDGYNYYIAVKWG